MTEDDYRLLYDIAGKRIEDLEKENEKLKTDYEVLSCSVGDFGELQNKLEEEQRKNNGLSDNLTKAKDILRMIVYWKSDKKELLNFINKAEQFLKEIEK